VRREVEDLSALITHVGAPAVVVGESSGGALALEAVLGSAPITKLALYEPPFIVTNDTEPMPADFPDRLDALIAADRREEVLEMFITLAAGLPAEAVAEARTSPMWPALRAVAHTIAYDTWAFNTRQFRRSLVWHIAHQPFGIGTPGTPRCSSRTCGCMTSGIRPPRC
jgi:pimeloyl-ACP methyl ester carboxylesterase